MEQGVAFVLNVFVEDVRSAPEGVFAVYLDVLYDSSVVAVNGSIVYSQAFPNGTSGDTSLEGIIDEVGAFSGSLTGTGAGESLLVSIPFVGIASGSAAFVADSAELSPAHDTGLFGRNDAVPAEQFRFLGDAVDVVLAGGAEGEAIAGAAFQASVDQVIADEADWWLP